jgi:hypothetical protein
MDLAIAASVFKISAADLKMGAASLKMFPLASRWPPSSLAFLMC